ncbi:glycosyltransferase family 4 protein [Listeria booriae]|uniref:Glycosyltransferase family 4 protein n=1 Tax=Listeria booriae TaxID=1552123 RepID=A0A842CY90_9LIST|nr:glycosyltransferase family 4 protein [Listeria booriae]MBC2004944.1 glycosyltransferase family 4 protein [Listeria booriae]
MKIVYIHQYFNKDKGSTRSYEVAKYLVTKGHQVTVITGNEVISCEGIDIVSTKTPYKQEYGYIRRLFSFLQFMLKSFIYVIREKDVDLIYATSTPLTVGLVGKWASKLKRCRFVFEVRDLWPDVPIELGIIRNKWLIRVLNNMEYGIYKQAGRIIALSSGMKDTIASKGIPEEKVKVITNFADIHQFETIKITEHARMYMLYPELQNHFISLYAGTIGFVNHVEYILKLAQNTLDPRILYVIVGDGKEKPRLVKESEQLGLKNVLFLDSVSKRDAMILMTMSDVGMCFVRPNPILNRNSQNKLFDFWAAGKPTLINYKGWQDEAMRAYEAGHGFDYEELDEMTAYIESICHHRDNYEQLSMNTKALANCYKKETQLESLELILQNTHERDEFRNETST